MSRFLVIVVCALMLQGCSTLASMFTAPEAAAANIATAGAETITGAPVSEVVGMGDSIASLDRALAENPDAANRDELLALRDHLAHRAESRSRMQPGDHIVSRRYDRRQPFDPAPSGLVAVRDEQGNLIGYQALQRYQGLEVDAERPGPFDWRSRSRDPWRFTQPRRYQLGRQVRPRARQRMVPIGSESAIDAGTMQPEAIRRLNAPADPLADDPLRPATGRRP